MEDEGSEKKLPMKFDPRISPPARRDGADRFYRRQYLPGNGLTRYRDGAYGSCPASRLLVRVRYNGMLGGFTMSESDKEIARRAAAALAAIKQSLTEEDSAVSMFASHHVEELDAAYWKKHAGTANPTPKQVVDLLELRSQWGGDDDDGIDVFDFTLPGDVTDYVISVRFDDDGEVQEVGMES